MSIPVKVGLLSIFTALITHLLIAAAEQRARTLYLRIMGEHEIAGRDDIWKDIRPYAGGWGCLTVLLRLLRGLGIAVAFSATLYTLFT
jgi:hypothetical protein